MTLDIKKFLWVVSGLVLVSRHKVRGINPSRGRWTYLDLGSPEHKCYGGSRV